MSADLMTALATFALVSSITPGPNNLMLMASGANFGLLRTLPHMLGVSLGFVVMMVAMGVGLVQVIAAFPASYTVMKGLSAVYLLYLAWKIASNRRPPGAARSTARPMSFLQAAAFQWINPKAVTMALTALTVYSPPAPSLGSIALAAGVFGLVNLPAITTWAAMGQQTSRFLNTPARLRLFNGAAGLLLVATLYPILMA